MYSCDCQDLRPASSYLSSRRIASATVQSRQAMAALVVDNILQHVSGRSLISSVN